MKYHTQKSKYHSHKDKRLFYKTANRTNTKNLTSTQRGGGHL